jgi:hypothetical protein
MGQMANDLKMRKDGELPS